MSSTPVLPHATPTLIIVGVGLLGGSLGLSLCRQGYTVYGLGRNPTSLNHAMAQGALTQGHTQWQPHWLDPATPTWVVLCLPLAANRAWLHQHTPLLKNLPNVWVTDVGSCKRQIVALGGRRLPGQFLGGHPLAGKALGGFEHATPNLFADNPWLYCPHADAPLTDVAQASWLQWVTATGATPHAITAMAHDLMMAWVSHVPQLYSYALAQGVHHALANSPLNHQPLYHGPAFTEHMRLNTSPMTVWADIFEENQDNIRQVWQQLNLQGQHVLEGLLHLADNPG
jgi:prephenate dehydrogenase